MQKLGILAAILGLLCVIGAIGRTVVTMASTFTAAQTDPSAPTPEFSLTGPLTIITIGVIAIVAGVVMVLAANRSDLRV